MLGGGSGISREVVVLYGWDAASHGHDVVSPQSPKVRMCVGAKVRMCSSTFAVFALRTFAFGVPAQKVRCANVPRTVRNAFGARAHSHFVLFSDVPITSLVLEHIRTFAPHSHFWALRGHAGPMIAVGWQLAVGEADFWREEWNN